MDMLETPTSPPNRRLGKGKIAPEEGFHNQGPWKDVNELELGPPTLRQKIMYSLSPFLMKSPSGGLFGSKSPTGVRCARRPSSPIDELSAKEVSSTIPEDTECVGRRGLVENLLSLDGLHRHSLTSLTDTHRLLESSTLCPKEFSSELGGMASGNGKKPTKLRLQNTKFYKKNWKQYLPNLLSLGSPKQMENYLELKEEVGQEETIREAAAMEAIPDVTNLFDSEMLDLSCAAGCSPEEFQLGHVPEIPQQVCEKHRGIQITYPLDDKQGSPKQESPKQEDVNQDGTTNTKEAGASSFAMVDDDDPDCVAGLECYANVQLIDISIDNASVGSASISLHSIPEDEERCDDVAPHFDASVMLSEVASAQLDQLDRNQGCTQVVQDTQVICSSRAVSLQKVGVSQFPKSVAKAEKASTPPRMREVEVSPSDYGSASELTHVPRITGLPEGMVLEGSHDRGFQSQRSALEEFSAATKEFKSVNVRDSKEFGEGNDLRPKIAPKKVSKWDARSSTEKQVKRIKLLKYRFERALQSAPFQRDLDESPLARFGNLVMPQDVILPSEIPGIAKFWYKPEPNLNHFQSPSWLVGKEILFPYQNHVAMVETDLDAEDMRALAMQEFNEAQMQLLEEMQTEMEQGPMAQEQQTDNNRDNNASGTDDPRQVTPLDTANTVTMLSHCLKGFMSDRKSNESDDLMASERRMSGSIPGMPGSGQQGLARQMSMGHHQSTIGDPTGHQKSLGRSPTTGIPATPNTPQGMGGMGLASAVGGLMWFGGGNRGGAGSRSMSAGGWAGKGLGARSTSRFQMTPQGRFSVAPAGRASAPLMMNGVRMGFGSRGGSVGSYGSRGGSGGRGGSGARSQSTGASGNSAGSLKEHGKKIEDLDLHVPRFVTAPLEHPPKVLSPPRRAIFDARKRRAAKKKTNKLQVAATQRKKELDALSMFGGTRKSQTILNAKNDRSQGLTALAAKYKENKYIFEHKKRDDFEKRRVEKEAAETLARKWRILQEREEILREEGYFSDEIMEALYPEKFHAENTMLIADRVSSKSRIYSKDRVERGEKTVEEVVVLNPALDKGDATSAWRSSLHAGDPNNPLDIARKNSKENSMSRENNKEQAKKGSGRLRNLLNKERGLLDLMREEREQQEKHAEEAEAMEMEAAGEKEQDPRNFVKPPYHLLTSLKKHSPLHENYGIDWNYGFKNQIPPGLADFMWTHSWEANEESLRTFQTNVAVAVRLIDTKPLMGMYSSLPPNSTYRLVDKVAEVNRELERFDTSKSGVNAPGVGANGAAGSPADGGPDKSKHPQPYDQTVVNMDLEHFPGYLCQVRDMAYAYSIGDAYRTQKISRLYCSNCKKCIIKLGERVRFFYCQACRDNRRPTFTLCDSCDGVFHKKLIAVKQQQERDHLEEEDDDEFFKDVENIPGFEDPGFEGPSVLNADDYYLKKDEVGGHFGSGGGPGEPDISTV